MAIYELPAGFVEPEVLSFAVESQVGRHFEYGQRLFGLGLFDAINFEDIYLL